MRYGLLLALFAQVYPVHANVGPAGKPNLGESFDWDMYPGLLRITNMSHIECGAMPLSGSILVQSGNCIVLMVHGECKWRDGSQQCVCQATPIQDNGQCGGIEDIDDTTWTAL